MMRKIANVSSVKDGEGEMFYSNSAVTQVQNVVKVTPYRYDLSRCRRCLCAAKSCPCACLCLCLSVCCFL